MADIRPQTLARPLVLQPPWNRSRAAYTDALLARAIAHGTDSSGQRLEASMPRWVLSEAQMRDLLAYMKRLGGE